MNFILPDHFADDLDSLRAVFKTKGDSKVTLLAQQRVMPPVFKRTHAYRDDGRLGQSHTEECS